MDSQGKIEYNLNMDNEAVYLNQDDLTRLFDAMDYGITVVDPKGPDYRILFANTAFEKMTGHTSEQLINAPFRQIIGRKTDVGTLQILEKALQEGRELDQEFLFYKTGGGQFLNGVKVKIFRNEQTQIRFYMVIYRDVSEIKRLSAEISNLKKLDSITGIYNRRQFREFVEAEVNKSRRYKKTPCLIMLEIDHFQDINDAYGHDIGDKVLAELALQLKNKLRKYDTIGRWGEKEFAILVTETNNAQTSMLAEKLRVMVEKSKYPRVENITVSIGVAEFEELDSTDSWLRKAKEAMFLATEKGRNTVFYF